MLFDKQKRVGWVDYCKGLGIFLVVIGHVLGGLQESSIISNSYWYRYVGSALYSFHMPLFFFISGLFARRSARKPLIDFIKDKAAVLVYPYFVWSLLQGATQVAASHYVNNPLYFTDLFKIVYMPIGQFWFLYTLFIIYVIYGVFCQASPSDFAFLALSVVCFIFARSSADMIQWEVAQDIGSYMIFFGVGAAVARSGILPRLAKLKRERLIAICTCGYAAVAIGVAPHIRHDGILWPPNAIPTHEGLLWPAFAIVGIVATVALAILLSDIKRLRFVELWGVLSLEIYVAHVIAAASVRIVLRQAFGVTEPLLHLVLGTGISIYAPILLAYLCERIGFPYVFTLSQSRLQPWRRGSRDGGG
jgi:fucose 4-O-acetylase-like acetyltransferase